MTKSRASKEYLTKQQGNLLVLLVVLFFICLAAAVYSASYAAKPVTLPPGLENVPDTD
jgi:hypothetical protein